MIKKLTTILLVDDDEVNNYVNEQILIELAISHSIVTLKNGRLALDYLQQHCQADQASYPQLVILDHLMPVMDGLELMQAYRKMNLPGKDKPVFLLLSANTSPKDLAHFQRLGVQEFTDKPLSEERVLEAYHKYWQKEEY